MALTAAGLWCGYGSKPILCDVEFSIGAGELVCLLGPNGVGKTTLFRTLLGLLRPLRGSVLLDGIAVGDISPSARARAIAYVPQVGSLTFSYNATEVAVMGRSPWLALHQTPSRSDLLIVDEVFERLSLSALKDQPFARLSSGEKQLVLIARALVQTPQYLVLDEPMSNLDFGNQSRVLSRIEQLRALGLGILMTTHHPNHAFETNGRVILIDKTRRIQVGAVDEILTAENLLAAYGVEVSVLRQELETGSVRRFCVSRRGRVAS